MVKRAYTQLMLARMTLVKGEESRYHLSVDNSSMNFPSDTERYREIK